MLRTEPASPSIHDELEQVIKRLYGLREQFAGLANDFGVPMPVEKTQVGHPVRGAENPKSTGVSELRTAITEINAQISLIENEQARLFRARTELFGLDNQWQETGMSPEFLAERGNPPSREIRQGDWGSHP